MSVCEVKVVDSCKVTPSEETPTKSLWLSALDLALAGRGHIPLVCFYRSASAAGNTSFDVDRFKAALARALVFFYPLAGRLGVDSDGRLRVDCAEQGVPFVVAHSDLTADSFSNLRPSSELWSFFVPSVDDSPPVVCAFQVTFLRCGGVAIGAAMHHGVADGISMYHFFWTLGTFYRDGAAAATPEPPCHDRTLLRGRSPPSVHPDALSVLPVPDLSLSEVSGTVGNEIFVISKEQLVALKRACAAGGGDVSTFCALSALVWQCLCATRRLPPDATTRLSFPANVRHSLNPPLPDNYFGNGIIALCATGEVRDIASEEQHAVAGRIRGAIRRMDDELVRSAVDLVEQYIAVMVPAATPASSMPETELRVVSWLGMPVYDADFGWGKPLVMHRAAQPRAGLVYLMDGAGGSVRILVTLEPAILTDFSRVLYHKIGNTAKL